jgi:hypothetical protein
MPKYRVTVIAEDEANNVVYDITADSHYTAIQKAERRAAKEHPDLKIVSNSYEEVPSNE